MTAGVYACMFSHKVTGGGRQDGGTDGPTSNGCEEVGRAALPHLLSVLASPRTCQGVKKVQKQCHGGYFNIV